MILFEEFQLELFGSCHDYNNFSDPLITYREFCRGRLDVFRTIGVRFAEQLAEFFLTKPDFL